MYHGRLTEMLITKHCDTIIGKKIILNLTVYTFVINWSSNLWSLRLYQWLQSISINGKYQQTCTVLITIIAMELTVDTVHDFTKRAYIWLGGLSYNKDYNDRPQNIVYHHNNSYI